MTSVSGQPVIDAHIHADFDLQSTRAKQLENEWRAAGVVGAVAHLPTGQAPDPKFLRAGVVHCAGVDDRTEIRTVEAGLASGRLKCLKIYLGYVHRYAYDPVYRPYYELAAKYKVPVVFHTGDTASKRAKLKYADPLTVDEVAVDHPNTTFVIAHCGYPWIESAAEVAYKNDNVYLECSALVVGDLSAMAPDQIDTYVVRPIAWVFGYIENPNKMMFGSDWPLTPVKPYLEAYKRAIPKEHWQKVFHDNAVRVFGMENRAAPPR